MTPSALVDHIEAGVRSYFRDDDILPGVTKLEGRGRGDVSTWEVARRESARD
jgi:hypothetical protein